MNRLLTAADLAELARNARRIVEEPGFDPMPVMLLRAPDGPQAWLLTEVAADGDTAYGLCDLGLGCPELGEVSLAWLASLRGPLGLPVERAAGFAPERGMTISTLARLDRYFDKV